MPRLWLAIPSVIRVESAPNFSSLGASSGTSGVTSGSSESGNRALWVYARCNRCQEALASRVDLVNDLSIADDGGYVCRKVLMGNKRCFQQIKVRLYFDGNRTVIDREISGGQFISAEDYESEAET